MDPGRTKSNLSFNDLKKFIRDDGPFDLRKFGVPFGSRVGLIFPNGAELAVGVIALLCHWCVLPINYANTPAETAAVVIQKSSFYYFHFNSLLHIAR